MKKGIVAIVSGVISGLFGAGGGLILLPALIHIFKLDEKEARGTTVFCILPMVLITGIFYSANKFIDWNLAIQCAIGGVIGAYIGSCLLNKLSNKVLRLTYIAFLIFVSVKMLVY